MKPSAVPEISGLPIVSTLSCKHCWLLVMTPAPLSVPGTLASTAPLTAIPDEDAPSNHPSMSSTYKDCSQMLQHCTVTVTQYWGYIHIKVLHCVSKKVSHLMFDNNFGKCYRFSKLFHLLIWFVKKFSMYMPQRFPPHLQYVATVSCEIQKSKNVTDFDSIHNKPLTCSCKQFGHFLKF